LQHFLRHWHQALHAARTATQGVVRWAIDVDPQSI
jgi:primosomal protein N'